MRRTVCKSGKFRGVAVVYVGSKFADGGLRKYEYRTTGSASSASFLKRVRELHARRMIRGKIRTIKVKKVN